MRNTASRMESSGEAGRIQISPDTKRRLPPSFQTTRRGVIQVKGKGEMVSYWLTGGETAPQIDTRVDLTSPRA